MPPCSFWFAMLTGSRYPWLQQFTKLFFRAGFEHFLTFDAKPRQYEAGRGEAWKNINLQHRKKPIDIKKSMGTEGRKEGRKEGRHAWMEGRKEGRKEGMHGRKACMDGRKEGRKACMEGRHAWMEGRKEGRNGMHGWKEGRKACMDGRKEGRKGWRKEGGTAPPRSDSHSIWCRRSRGIHLFFLMQEGKSNGKKEWDKGREKERKRKRKEGRQQGYHIALPHLHHITAPPPTRVRNTTSHHQTE